MEDSIYIINIRNVIASAESKILIKRGADMMKGHCNS